jgi:hypothetical protein
VTRSVRRTTLRYPFLHGTRNLESRGTHAKPCGILSVMGFDLLRMFDHAVKERFLKTENRALVLARDQPADQLQAWRSCVRCILRNDWTR